MNPLPISIILWNGIFEISWPRYIKPPLILNSHLKGSQKYYGRDTLNTPLIFFCYLKTGSKYNDCDILTPYYNQFPFERGSKHYGRDIWNSPLIFFYWRGVSKYYDCSMLTPILIINSHWRGGSNYYGRNILTPSNF